MNEEIIRAMELALEALEGHTSILGLKDREIDSKAITAIREALAERFCDNNCTWRDHHPECDKAEQPTCKQALQVEQPDNKECKKCSHNKD